MSESNEDEDDYVIVKPQGIPAEIGIVLIVVTVLSLVAGSYLSLNPVVARNDACGNSDVVQKAALESRKAQMQVAEQQQKGIFALQMEVSRSCAAKGWVPIFTNGNVSCQK